MRNELSERKRKNAKGARCDVLLWHKNSLCRQEKLEKLRKGVLKHDFNDPEFSTQSEEILEKTDEALDAAMRAQVCSDGQTTPESGDESDDSIDVDVAGEKTLSTL